MKKPTHSTIALLTDSDLLVAVDALLRELRDPPAEEARSLFSFGAPTTAITRISYLACLREEIAYREWLAIEELTKESA